MATKKYKTQMNVITGLLDQVADEVEYYLGEIDDLGARLAQESAIVKARDIKIMTLDRELDGAVLSVKDAERRLEEARDAW